MINELTKLIQEYKDYCDSETKRLQKKNKNSLITMPFTFEGFFEWISAKGLK